MALPLKLKGAEFELLPFGAGWRMCPGMSFGLANVELALASLLFHFDWEAPGAVELDMTEALGLTAHRKARLLLRPILRIPVPGVWSLPRAAKEWMAGFTSLGLYHSEFRQPGCGHL